MPPESKRGRSTRRRQHQGRTRKSVGARDFARQLASALFRRRREEARRPNYSHEQCSRHRAIPGRSRCDRQHCTKGSIPGKGLWYVTYMVRFPGVEQASPKSASTSVIIRPDYVPEKQNSTNKKYGDAHEAISRTSRTYDPKPPRHEPYSTPYRCWNRFTASQSARDLDDTTVDSPHPSTGQGEAQYLFRGNGLRSKVEGWLAVYERRDPEVSDPRQARSPERRRGRGRVRTRPARTPRRLRGLRRCRKGTGSSEGLNRSRSSRAAAAYSERTPLRRWKKTESAGPHLRIDPSASARRGVREQDRGTVKPNVSADRSQVLSPPSTTSSK